jgi:hypothetical protein
MVKHEILDGTAFSAPSPASGLLEAWRMSGVGGGEDAGLVALFESHAGNKSDKWSHYPEIFERHLAPLRGKPVSLLEIGVFNGGSLQIWRRYFGAEARIVGVDIDPTSSLLIEDEAEIVIGDQADPAFLENLKARMPRLDVVIDDGGHHAHQQVATFEALYPHLSDGGIYIVEDLHTSYWPHFGGGFGRESFIERAKRMIDLLHEWYWYNPNFNTYINPLSEREQPMPVGDFAKSTFGLHFYDSMLVIEKRAQHEPWLRLYGQISREEVLRKRAQRTLEEGGDDNDGLP